VTIEIKEREEHRVALFMSLINQNEKTLVFCANQTHALVVRDFVNQMKSSSDPNYCQRVTADEGELGEQYLRDFQDNEKTIPTILTTSQKLATGVDARNIRNIVLMRPIHSMIEFKQIIGRGTRLYDGKDYFTIYDFVKAHHHFNDPEWDGEPIEPEEPKPCPKCGGYPSHYVSVGVEELDQQKLTPLLRLKYHDSIADAVADLGRPDEIGKIFSGFQKYLYQNVA